MYSYKSIVIAFMLLMFGSLGVEGHDSQTIDLSKITSTYTLNGESISPEEILNLHKIGRPFHCSEVSGKDQFACFDTVDEAVEFASTQISVNGSVQSRCASHWTYYVNTGWNTVSHVLSNGQANNNHSPVWSHLTTCTPNSTTIWNLENQGGAPSFTYVNSYWSLTFFPLGGGGGRSSKVN